MANNGQSGWTDNESTADWGTDKTPPPPPEPGLYKFEVVEAKAEKVGKDNKPGVKLTLMLTEPFGGGEAVNQKVWSSHACSKERWYVILQLAAACGVDAPKSNGSEAVKDFCRELLDSRGGIARIKHGKGLDGQPRAEVAFGSSYLTEAEAAAIAAGVDPSEAAETAPANGGRRGRGKSSTASA